MNKIWHISIKWNTILRKKEYVMRSQKTWINPKTILMSKARHLKIPYIIGAREIAGWAKVTLVPSPGATWRRKWTSASCPLTAVYTLWHVPSCIHTHTR